MTFRLVISLAVASFSAITFAQSRVIEPSAAQRNARESHAALERATKARGRQFVLTTRPARRVEASIVFAAVAPKLSVDRWMLFIPQPPDLPGRQERIRHEARPDVKPVTEPVDLKRPLLLWEMPADEKSKSTIAVGITYHADLYSRKLNPRTATSAVNFAPLSELEQTHYTQTTTLMDYSAGAFQEWLVKNQLRPKTGETDIDLARRAFLHIKERSTFEYKPDIERRASGVCASMKSDCGGLTALFVAALRANGIPARQLIGRWAQSAKPDDKLGATAWAQEHIKAEFFAQDVGWVPLDLSVAVEHDKAHGSLKYFANDEGDFICFHTDAEIAFDVPNLGRRSVRFHQEPAVFYLGKGTLEGMTKKCEWAVKARRL